MKVIHSMIRVLDYAKSIDFYAQAFGLSVKDRYDFPRLSLIYLANHETGFELELTLNKDRSDAYDLGNGNGHLAVSVEDIHSLHERLSADGLRRHH